MKKIFLFLLIATVQISQAQITITSADMPVLGDTLRISSALLDANVLTNYQRSGANQTWIFDSLRVTSQTVREFVPASTTPYNSVPNDRIGVKFADTISLGDNSVNDVYNFANSTTSDFSVDWRAASIPTGIPLFPVFIMQNSYVDKDEIFQFPLDFQDRDSSNFDFVFNNVFPPLYYRSSGYRVNHVDAWGSVTTPYGTFNTLRVISDLVSSDSVSFDGQNISVPTHLREYQWIANGERIPVMKVSGLVVAGTFVPNVVEFRDSARIVEPLLPTIALFRVDTTTIEVGKSLSFDNLSIGSSSFQWDFTPSTVNYINGSSTSRNISVSFQDTGVYDVRLIATGGSQSDTLTRVNYIRVISEQGEKPQADFGVDTTVVPTGFDYIIYNKSKAASGATYQWTVTPSQSFSYRQGTNAMSTDSIVVNFIDTGFYDVKLVVSDNFGKDSLTRIDYIFAKNITGLGEVDLDLSRQILLHPNPLSGGNALTIEFKQKLRLLTMEIYDSKGRLIQREVYHQKVDQLKPSLDLNPGMYFIKMDTDQGIALKKLLIQ